ncbi:hypothetical protein [Metapseudomonas otitidis]|uniref:hypothetical protein n=1 Tax=Metapseudomonas otitidis TaxID=319939 RepID=UPI00244B7A62|nr:hypothetical protein [Pseudomonas otitidis]MDG9785156.1 hypothetical protein [Pseudomonas otitidis]
MQLPDALKPWHNLLEGVAPELAEHLAAMLDRLQALVGPFRERTPNGQPEPEGLGDLRRRGPYERLLSSEWLLAEEFPDEFLRRAAGGEHLFLAPQQREQRRSRLIVALFDAGPRQLGAPRLAHLAMLILLARRAREANGELRWGSLQAPAWHDGLQSQADLTQLLEARSWAAAEPAHWQAWQALLDTLPETPDECWLIGGPADHDTISHNLQVTTRLDGKALEITLHQANLRRSLDLLLPPPAMGKRLLLGQFASMGLPGSQASAQPEVLHTQRVALTLPPVIAHSGQLVALTLLDQKGALVFKLPPLRGKKTTLAKVYRQNWPASNQPLAMAFQGKSLGAVVDTGAYLRFWQLPGFDAVKRPPLRELNAPPGTANLLPLALVNSNHESQRLYLLDAAEHLLSWNRDTKAPNHEPPTLQWIESNVLAMAGFEDGGFCYLYKRDQRFFLKVISSNPSTHPWRLGEAGEPNKAFMAFMARAYKSTSPPACALLMETTPQERWRICRAPYRQDHERESRMLDVPGGWNAQGLVRTRETGALSLVLMSSDRKSLSLYSGSTLDRFFDSPDPIARLSVCPASGLVAILTHARELVVYCSQRQVVRLRAHCTLADDEGAQP